MQRITTYEVIAKTDSGVLRRRTHTFTHVAGKDTVLREYHLALPDGAIHVYDVREQQEGESPEEYKAYRDGHTAKYHKDVKSFLANVHDD